MKVNIISKKLIKPHTPTPPNLKNYQISFVDQLMEPLNIAIILFYQSKPVDYDIQLQESLAKTLVQFYPLAGRYIKNDHMVDCNDEGAEFIEAEALDIELLDLVAKNEAEQLNALLNQHLRVNESTTDPLLSIQATRFSCGGAAIAVSVTHRVFDVSSLETFVAAWSSDTDPDKTAEFTTTPVFNVPSLLPYLDLDIGLGSDKLKMVADKVFIKRLVFNKEVLTTLKSGSRVSGARVACAVIAKALIRVDRAKHGEFRDFLMFHAVNMRGRTSPPLPKHLCGNFSFPTQSRRVTASEAKEIGIHELIDLMSDDIRKSVSEYAGILSPDSDGRRIIMNALGNFSKKVRINPETNVLAFTDWSKFGFCEADFGWGKPVWTSIGPDRPCLSSALLTRDKDGDGIEAWVHLNQNDMRYFDQDQEIKLFTT